MTTGEIIPRILTLTARQADYVWWLARILVERGHLTTEQAFSRALGTLGGSIPPDTPPLLTRTTFRRKLARHSAGRNIRTVGFSPARNKLARKIENYAWQLAALDGRKSLTECRQQARRIAGCS